ncbi:MAG: hypothetical protein M1829_005870 [Trizodia sp. TS-e1964]|nr:MAG: hypothetical protein M1829_005870 [Trizodia sp. TS-e1964]
MPDCPDLLCYSFSIATFLFPVFASYKALKTNDPSQLKPWLMYWVVLACFLVAESWTEWAFVWFPFYAWIRAFTLLYLVLPQSQGARLIYQTRIDPFLTEHELQIDDFISSSHERAKALGLQYIMQAIEFIKVTILGMPRAPRPPRAQNLGLSYAQNLFARFNLPSASTSAPAGEFYGFLSQALSQATAGSSASSRAQPSASSTLVPDTLRGTAERMNYISVQKERLNALIQALDREAGTMPRSPPRSGAVSASSGSSAPSAGARQVGEGLKKSRSEVDFERVEHDDLGEPRGAAEPLRTPGGSWMPWNWSPKGPVHASAAGSRRGEQEGDVARASGVDTGR